MATKAVVRPLNTENLNALLRQAVADMVAANNCALILIGGRLSLFRAMKNDEHMSAAELSRCTRTFERCMRKWLNGNAAGQYVENDATEDAQDS